MQRSKIFSKIAVVGVGLIGGSILRAIKKFSSSTITAAYDADPRVRERVQALGLSSIVIDRLEELGDSNLIVVCVPSHAVSDVIISLSTYVDTGTVITDVASVKSAVMRQVFEQVPENFPYVPGHPMAGSEQSGPDAGVEMLFQNRTCFLTPHTLTPNWATESVERFWNTIGANSQRITPEVHDRLVALSSHLPHLVAFALMEILDREFAQVASPMSFISGGLREQIRLGQSNTAVWNDIFRLNAEPLLERLEMLEQSLRDWRTAISDGPKGQINQRLLFAKNAAKKFSVGYGG